MKSLLLRALLLLLVTSACEPAEPAQHAKSRKPSREAVLTNAENKAEYDRGRAMLGSLDALRGAAMTEALANDLGFKCADLKSASQKLEGERDPLVWQFRSDVARTCGLDVPLACARFDIERIETKRRSEPGANVKGECLGLRLAIGDFGRPYLENPDVVSAAGKYATYCSGGDDVRTVP